MTQQPDDATRRVVKKVVKRTVVRPVAPSTARAGTLSDTPPVGGPRQRTARLTTPARAQATRSAAPVVAPVSPAPQSPAAPSPAPARASSPSPAPTTVQPVVEPVAEPGPARTSRFKPSLPKPDIKGRASDLGYGIGDRVGGFGRGVGHKAVDGVDAVRHGVADGWAWLIGLRLPHLSPVKGSAVTGVLVGLLAVTMGWGFYELFSRTLGTQAGGGWGFLAFVFLSFVAFIVGELLLAGFGVPHGRVVSILSVLLVLLMVLVFFIKLAAGIWAWALIPVLFALSFMVSSVVMGIAAKEKNRQRLPWEPTDESQVKL